MNAAKVPKQHLKHISPLSEDLAVAVESDPTVNNLVAELLDHDHLLAQVLGHEDEQRPSQEVQAVVTKLFSCAGMLSNPKALDAVKAGADGLIKAGTWSLDSVRDKEDVRAEAKRTGVSAHFGQLMAIASIFFFGIRAPPQLVRVWNAGSSGIFLARSTVPTEV